MIKGVDIKTSEPGKIDVQTLVAAIGILSHTSGIKIVARPRANGEGVSIEVEAA